MNRSVETRLYRWGWALFVCVAAAVCVKRLFFPDVNLLAIMPHCVFHTLTGYYCPGCGGTRSVAALLSGHWLVSAVDYPMVMYCFLVYAWFMVSHTVDKISRHRIPVGMKYKNAWLYGALAVVLIHFVVKNIFYIRTGVEPFL